LSRELTVKVYGLTKKAMFARDFGLKGQIQDAAGSSMHNIAEGFDAETNAEFIRFLRYAKRSCTEVQTCPPSLSPIHRLYAAANTRDNLLRLSLMPSGLRRGRRGQLYVALDQQYITNSEFQDVYDHAARTRAAIRGFIKYLINYEKHKNP